MPKQPEKRKPTQEPYEPLVAEQKKLLAADLAAFGDDTSPFRWALSSVFLLTAIARVTPPTPALAEQIISACELCAQILRQGSPHWNHYFPINEGVDPLPCLILIVALKANGANQEQLPQLHTTVRLLPDNPIQFAPDGRVIIPPSTPRQHRRAVEAIMDAMEAQPAKGRPRGTGTFRGAAECEQAIAEAMSALNRQGKEPSQENVAEMLRATDRQIRNWLKDFALEWDALRRKYGDLMA